MQNTTVKGTIVVPILLIAVGVGWLLTVQSKANINWIWSIALAAGGILILVLSGIDKASIVFGPLLLIASVCSVLRQTDVLGIDIEIPVLVIALGALMLAARHPSIPEPKWVKDGGPKES